MESTEANSIDDSLDSKNLEASMEDIVVAKYEDCNSEDLSSQNEEDQSGEQVYGYLEVRNPGSEDATIILDSEGFNLNGQKLILTQGDDGNGIIVLVNEDPNQPLEQTFANASVLHPDDVNFDENGLKEHGALVMDEHSQGLEFIETEEVPQEHEERHVYIENSGGFINISSETQCGQCDSVNIEQPLWSVSNNAQIKNDSTEMLFIPNPTVVLAPEETKHRKLMQLACIAHELQSADQKSSIAAVSESAKDVETSLSEFETSVIVTRNEEPKDPNEDLAGTSEEVKDHENAECLPSNECKNNHLDVNSKGVSKSVDVSSLVRAVDNTVSVIHTTSSELQDNSLENQAKDSSPSDFSSVKNYHTPESELPSEMLYPSGLSKVSLHDSLSEEPSNTKQLDECTREDMVDNSQLAIADDSNESKSPRTNVISREMELDCSPGDDDSPITFIEKSQKLDGVDTLGIEDNPLGEAGADIRVDDDDSHADPCIAVEEDDGFKEANESSSPAATKDTFSAEENHLLNDSGINQRTRLMKNKVPADADSELSTSDNDDSGIYDHGSSTSKADVRFMNKKYLYKYKTKSHKSYLAKKYISSPVLPDNTSEINCPYTLTESNVEDSTNNENDKSEPMDFENSPPDNSESDLVIAENADEEEFNSVNHSMSKHETQKSTTEDTVESNKIQSIESVNSEKEINSVEKNSENLAKDFVQELPTDSQPIYKEVDSQPIYKEVDSQPIYKEVDSQPIYKEVDSQPIYKEVDIQPIYKEGDNENSSVTAAPSSLDSSAVDDDFSYNEETLVKTPIKTYIRKKVKKNIVENKSSIKQNIELFSVDDLNFSECDKDINDVENSLNSDQLKESVSSSPENNAEADDLLLSDVQSKVSATYNRKKRSVLPLKQGLRTRSLRPRSLPAKLPLENGTQEISDSESKKNSFDSSSSENIPWGDVLMSTSFQPRAETNKDEPSTSYASKSIIASSTPLLSPEQRKRKLNKYTRDFERLLHSSPVSSKKLKTNKKRQIQRGRKRLLKSRQSNVLPTSSYSEFLGPCETSNLYNVGASTSTGSHRKRREVKKAKIQYLNQNTIRCHEEPRIQKKELFSCSTCNFVSRMVDNLIEHLKYCKSIQPVFSYCVNDMEKRQMIRGDDSFDKEEVTGGCNGTVRNNERRNSSQGEFSGGQSQDLDEGLDLDFISDNKKRKKTQYGYGEDDVVWVKYKDRFWPALVCEIRGSKAHVRLIKHPEADKGLKVKHENIRTFDDAKWNCLCLKEAVNLPNNEIFVKSVQSAETFMRRKFLGLYVKGKTFFSVREGVDFATDTASSDSIVDDSDDDDEAITIRFPAPSRKYRYETLDKERILGYILEGSVNDYVLDIYNEKVHSDKHLKFFDPEGRANLEHRPWFGPFEEKSEKERLFFHFRDLFSAKVGEDACKKRKFGMTAYVTQVLIPEAIVKAISVVNDISIEAAETLFESEDSLDMDCDPEPGEIHKMYS